MPFTETLFWFGFALFCNGILFLTDWDKDKGLRNIASIISTVVGLAGMGYASYVHNHPGAALPIPIWVYAFLLTCTMTCFNIYEWRRKRKAASVSTEPSKLVIHSALYGDGSVLDMDVKERLQQLNHDALAVHVSNGTFGRDPVPGVPKNLRVKYSYDNPHVFELSRPENAFLLLPEDSWSRHKIEELTEQIRIAPLAEDQIRQENIFLKTKLEKLETDVERTKADWESKKKLLHWPHLRFGESLTGVGFIEEGIYGVGLRVQNDELEYDSTARNLKASIALHHGNRTVLAGALWFDPQSRRIIEEDEGVSLGMQQDNFLLIFCWDSNVSPRIFKPLELPPNVYRGTEVLDLGQWDISVRIIGANCIGDYQTKVILTPRGDIPGLAAGIRSSNFRINQ